MMEDNSTEAVNKRIAEMFDEETRLWEEKHGEHMHSGFYDPNLQVSGSVSDHKAAEVRFIDEALKFAGLLEDPKKWPKNVVDVGCGVGGSSFYFAKKFGAKCHGINISPVQIQRAKSLADAQGLSDKVFFNVGDAAELPFPDGQFDLVWVLESAEYVADRKKLIGELCRVTAPGGRVIITSWFHRNLNPSEESLQEWEKEMIKKTTDSYYISGWSSIDNDFKLFESFSFQDMKAADWSQNVVPFWASELASGSLDSALPLFETFMEGYKKSLFKYGIVTAKKPETE